MSSHSSRYSRNPFGNQLQMYFGSKLKNRISCQKMDLSWQSEESLVHSWISFGFIDFSLTLEFFLLATSLCKATNTRLTKSQTFPFL